MSRMRSTDMPRAALIALAVAASACGYALTGTQQRVPGDIRSVSIGDFDNYSREEGLDKLLAFAFEREFYERGRLRLRETIAEGEGVITGAIREFKTRPVSFDADDDALQYEAKLTVDVTLQRQADGEVLWRAARLEVYEEYSVNRQTVVPSSSQFQRGTLDFGDLADLSDIQLAETEKRLAIERLVRAVVRDVHDRILDDF